MRQGSLRRVALCSLLLLSAAAVFAKPMPPRNLPASERKLIILEAYRNLNRLAAAGDHQLLFKIRNIQTVEAAQFGGAFWVDLVTMPGGEMIDVMRETTSFGAGHEIVVYRPAWNLKGPEYLLTEEGGRLQSMTADQVLAEVAGEIPEAREVTAITSYEVEVSFQDRSRSYRAAVLWLPARPGRGATLYFVDHITQGVEEAARERPRARRPAGGAPGLAAKSLYTCSTDSYERFFDKALSDTTGHSSGKHGSRLTAKIKCSCDANCTSLCDPTVLLADCHDTGFNVTPYCHRMATTVNSNVASKGDAISTGASCGVGLGCVKKDCFLCMCSLGVEVNIANGKVSFGSTGGPDWTGNSSFEVDCAACAMVPTGGSGDIPPLVQDPDPPSNNGSGVRNCTWRCVVFPFNGIYSEECTLSCPP